MRKEAERTMQFLSSLAFAFGSGELTEQEAEAQPQTKAFKKKNETDSTKSKKNAPKEKHDVRMSHLSGKQILMQSALWL